MQLFDKLLSTQCIRNITQLVPCLNGSEFWRCIHALQFMRAEKKKHSIQESKSCCYRDTLDHSLHPISFPHNQEVVKKAHRYLVQVGS